MATYTTTHLLDSISRKGFVPTDQATFTETELLAIADEQTLNIVVPSILAVREEFFVFHVDYDITAGTAGYKIPARAAGMQVRDVAIVNGDAVNPALPRLEIERLTLDAQGEPTGFYLKNNRIMLYPTPSSSGKQLRVYYFLRPSKLILTSDAAVISAIDTATNTVTVASIPSAWTSSDQFDLIKQDGAHEPLAIDQSATVSGSDIIFASLPGDLRVGDYVSLAGETPLVQLPPEYHAVLAQAVAAEILDGQNQPGADKAMKKLQGLLAVAQRAITPRVQGEDRVIVNTTWCI